MNKRKLPEVNAGSMADIAFLLLIFFLVTTTMDTDTGIQTLLPPYRDEEDVNSPAKNNRDVFEILVNNQNQIMVEKQEMSITDLTEATKKFILNPSNSSELSSKEIKTIEFFGQIEVSKGIISIQTANDTKYHIYLMVQNEVIRAFNEMRDTFAKNKFGKEYSQLDKSKKDAIRKVCPKFVSEAEPVNVTSSLKN